MDLKDFVADVISQLTEGVLEAIKRHDAKRVPGRINPYFPSEGESAPDWRSGVQNIEFDISVTVSDKASIDGGGEVKVYVADFKTTGSKAHESMMTNRIKFTIPVALPHQLATGTWPSTKT